MSLHRTCCCNDGIPSPDCCDCDLATSYAISASIGGTGVNSCGNSASIAVTNGTTVLGQGASGCPFCGLNSNLGIGTYSRSHWGTVLSSSPWTGLGLGSTTCPPGSNFDCSVGGAQTEPGTTFGSAGGNLPAGFNCIGGLTCIHEIDETTGASYYYWHLALSFESTATSGLPGGPGGFPTQRWYMGFRTFSELQGVCHPPQQALWPNNNNFPPTHLDLKKYNTLKNQAYIAYQNGPLSSWTYPATCYVGADYFFGVPLNTSSVFVQIT